MRVSVLLAAIALLATTTIHSVSAFTFPDCNVSDHHSSLNSGMAPQLSSPFFR